MSYQLEIVEGGATFFGAPCTHLYMLTAWHSGNALSMKLLYVEPG